MVNKMKQKKTENSIKMLLFLMVVFLLKILLMFCFSSDYQDAMFYPFVNQFLNGLGGEHWNTYEFYYQNGMMSSFPYPPLMLLIEAIPVGIIRVFNLQNPFILCFIFKIPILLFDCLCTWTLMELFPQKRKYAILLCFTSPIILYAGYMHGQLDIIPTALLLLSILVLFKKCKGYQWIFGLILASCILTKQHTASAFPILLIYMMKRDGLRKTLQASVTAIFIIAGFISPFWSEGFYHQVVFNQEQNMVLKVFFSYGSMQLILPLIALLFLYLKVLYTDKMNKELMLSFCGLLFMVFLVFVPPMPGWYIWIVPFITIFFMEVSLDKYKNLFLYISLNVCYLVYFLFLHKTEYTDLYFWGSSMEYLKNMIPMGTSVIRNIMFTMLTGLLIYTVYQMYCMGILTNTLYQRGALAFTIGIAGDSGSGKTTILERIYSILGRKNILEIEGDGDHKWERGEKMWEQYTHLDPKANYLYRQARDIKKLKEGKSVYRVEYDHNSGTFTEEHKVSPRKYIMVCGLHSLYLPQMRKTLDLKIYMDTEESLRRYWKIHRDTEHRGYSPQQITEQINTRMADSIKYIMPQKQYADLVIQYLDRNLTDCFAEEYKLCISLKFTVSSALDLEPLMKRLKEEKIEVNYEYAENLEKQVILIDGETLEKASPSFATIGYEMIPQLEEITVQGFSADIRDAIMELFILAVISGKMKGDI